MAVAHLRDLYRKVISEAGHHAAASQLTIENPVQYTLKAYLISLTIPGRKPGVLLFPGQ
jgi:hypothetical protein